MKLPKYENRQEQRLGSLSSFRSSVTEPLDDEDNAAGDERQALATINRSVSEESNDIANVPNPKLFKSSSNLNNNGS